MATVRIYVRASTKDQNAERALSDLIKFSKAYSKKNESYVENYSGTKLDRPQLTKLLNEAKQGDILLVESVDRLSRLSQDEFSILKQRIKNKGLRLVVADLPTTHTISNDSMDMFKSLLIKNRDIIHGGFALTEDGTKVIFRYTLQIHNLDQNEFDAAINSLSLLMSEYYNQLISFSKL